MTVLNINITSPLNAETVESKLNLANKEPGIINLANTMKALAAGNASAVLEFELDPAHAVGTITFTDNPTNDQTCNIIGTVLTAKTSGAGTNEFNLGAGTSAGLRAADVATNLKNCINASLQLNPYLEATSSAGVVTVTVKQSGTLGNALIMSDALSNCDTVSFAGGDEGDEYTWNFN